jgi:osmotically-inducible protein OsmY
MALPAWNDEKAARQTDKPTTKPDNTGVNRADRSAGGTTADKAKNNRTDRQLMQEIRKALVADKSLSTYAHNVKVIAEHGKVTLKGPVRSDAERRTVEAKAIEIAGAENVTNNITVKNEATAKP